MFHFRALSAAGPRHSARETGGRSSLVASFLGALYAAGPRHIAPETGGQFLRMELAAERVPPRRTWGGCLATAFLGPPESATSATFAECSTGQLLRRLHLSATIRNVADRIRNIAPTQPNVADTYPQRCG